MKDHNTCPHCGGTGKIELTGIYAETLNKMRKLKFPYIVANQHAEQFGCKPTALNNRLRKLEEHGHVFSERYGVQRRFYLCVATGKAGSSSNRCPLCDYWERMPNASLCDQCMKKYKGSR